MVWEVRGGAGSDSNGGGFDPGVTSPGTDYSQQNSAQISYTDLVIGSTNTQITSAANPFGSAHVGNVINITSGTGFTVQRVEIISVSGTTATCDKAVGTASSTGGHGALATIAAAAALMVVSNVTWIKASATYTVTSALSFGVTSNTGGPTSFIGYTSTRGDGGQITWTTSTNSVDLVAFTGGYNYLFQNIKFTNTAGTPGSALRAVGANVSTLAVVNCYFSGFLYAINGDYSVDYTFTGLMLDSCEITSCTSDGIHTYGGVTITACYIHSNTGNGIYKNSGASGAPDYMVILNSVIKSNAGTAGILYAGTSTLSPFIINNCAIINNTGDGLRMGGTGYIVLQLWNSIIDSNGGYGINYSVGNSTLYWGPSFRNNAYWNNTSGDLNSTGTFKIAKDASDVTLTGDPFVSRSTGNFALNSTAGAGAACSGAGYPTVIPG
jgi:hypothetical protein